MPPDSLVAEFGRMLEAASAKGPSAINDLYVRQLEPRDGALLRLCALPHEFDAPLLPVLSPELSAAEAEARCRVLAALPLVNPSEHGFVLHDALRTDLIAAWLTPERRAEFAAASGRLVRHFERAAEDASTELEREAATRAVMYHLVGVDEGRGMELFERLCRAARRQYRLSACASLVRLVHEYDRVLSHGAAATLAYHEAKLALDERNWDRATTLLERLTAGADIPRGTRIRAKLRLGTVLCERGRRPEALALYREAAEEARKHPEDADLVARAQLEEALALRDLGELDKAAATFRASADTASPLGRGDIQASAMNGLGSVLLRLNQPREAILAFDESIQHIDPALDALRVASVYNNLGTANRLLARWPEAEGWFRRSLEIICAAGDPRARATALTNLAQVQFQRGEASGALATTTEAVSLFEKVGDLARAAVAVWNEAKYHRKVGDLLAARAAYARAEELFARAREWAQHELVLAEATTLGRRPRIPWWAWVSLGLVAAAVVGVIVLIGAER